MLRPVNPRIVQNLRPEKIVGILASAEMANKGKIMVQNAIH